MMDSQKLVFELLSRSIQEKYGSLDDLNRLEGGIINSIPARRDRRYQELLAMVAGFSLPDEEVAKILQMLVAPELVICAVNLVLFYANRRSDFLKASVPETILMDLLTAIKELELPFTKHDLLEVADIPGLPLASAFLLKELGANKKLVFDKFVEALSGWLHNGKVAVFSDGPSILAREVAYGYYFPTLIPGKEFGEMYKRQTDVLFGMMVDENRAMMSWLDLIDYFGFSKTRLEEACQTALCVTSVEQLKNYCRRANGVQFSVVSNVSFISMVINHQLSSSETLEGVNAGSIIIPLAYVASVLDLSDHDRLIVLRTVLENIRKNTEVRDCLDWQPFIHQRLIQSLISNSNDRLDETLLMIDYFLSFSGSVYLTELQQILASLPEEETGVVRRLLAVGNEIRKEQNDREAELAEEEEKRTRWNAFLEEAIKDLKTDDETASLFLALWKDTPPEDLCF